MSINIPPHIPGFLPPPPSLETLKNMQPKMPSSEWKDDVNFYGKTKQPDKIKKPAEIRDGLKAKQPQAYNQTHDTCVIKNPIKKTKQDALKKKKKEKQSKDQNKDQQQKKDQQKKNKKPNRNINIKI
jgi:hypothetical protein